MVSPDSHRITRVLWYSSSKQQRFIVFADGAITLYGGSFQRPLANNEFFYFAPRMQTGTFALTTPRKQRLQSWHFCGLGSSRFARHYSGNLLWFLLLGLLWCFSSPAYHPPPLWQHNQSKNWWLFVNQRSVFIKLYLQSGGGYERFTLVGFPIRKSSDQRFSAPPRSLSQPNTSFIGHLSQGIHQYAFN